MRRVMIIGQPGSGKSTLARKLGERTGLPVFHIDEIHWKAGWVERTQEEKIALCQEVHAQDAWIFEGAHTRTWPERVQRCDTVIWLDYPVGIRFWRVVKRSLRYWGRTRPDLPDGCPERFSWEFYRWIWNTRKTGTERIQKLLAHLPEGKEVVVIRSLKAVDDYVATCSDETNTTV